MMLFSVVARLPVAQDDLGDYCPDGAVADHEPGGPEWTDGMDPDEALEGEQYYADIEDQARRYTMECSQGGLEISDEEWALLKQSLD